jgi:protein involved in polysaccharide export with SLBB domain
VTGVRRPHLRYGWLLLPALLLLAPATSHAQQLGRPSSDGDGATPAPADAVGIGLGEHAPAGADSRSAGANGVTLPMSGPIDPDVYRVGPGDQLVLFLHGQVTRTIPLEVDPEGRLLLPGAGVMRVSGRTLHEVRTDLLGRLRGQFRNVEVDLRLGRPRTFRVYVAGQVRTPGPVTVNGTYRAGDVLAGDLLLEGASHRRIEVIRADGRREYCDLDLLQKAGDASRNPWLRDGDMVLVPSATEYVFAHGAVARPGRYELGVEDSLRSLLRLAGDPLPSATLDSLLFVRFNDRLAAESLWVNLEDVYSRRVNPALRDGSRFYVYFIPRFHLQHEASVLGEVTRPGAYPIVEGRTRLSQLLRSAEGFQPDADLTSIRVHRRSTLAGEKDPELERLLRLSRNELTASEYEVLNTKLAGLREDYRVDWNRLQRDSDLDLLMRDDDIVRVERLVMSIRVDGQVRRPGIINFVPGAGVESYVGAAGGFTNRAWRGKVRVIRAVTGQTLPARNVGALDSGDFIWVPERPDVTAWDQAGRLLTSFAQLATIVIAIRSLR